MRRLIWAVLTVSGLWGGYWFAGSTMLERAVRDRLAAEGPRVQVASADVAGFPNRFDLTLTDLQVGQPGDVVWRAPFVQLLTLSYTPWHLVAALPPTQSVTLPDGTVLTLTADKLQASLRVAPSTDAGLQQTVVEGHALALRATGPLASLATLNFGTRLDPTRPDTHEIGLNLIGLRLDPALFAPLPDRPLPQGDAGLHLDAFVGFSAPLDRFAGETRPAPLLIDLQEMRFEWGEIALLASGKLSPDADGVAEGQIDLTLSGWESAIAVAVASGTLRPEIAPTVAELARRLDEASPVAGRIDLPLVMADGQMRLGPLPLGPAPRLLP